MNMNIFAPCVAKEAIESRKYNINGLKDLISYNFLKKIYDNNNKKNKEMLLIITRDICIYGLFLV